MSEGPSALAMEQALRSARAEAERLGVHVAIAMVDTGGNLSSFLRVGRAFLASTDLAIDKAWTAASFGMSTRAFSELLDTMPSNVRNGLMLRPRVTVVPGGFPILRDGMLAGAIGVSGGSDTEDEMIAQGGLAALEQQARGECHGGERTAQSR